MSMYTNTPKANEKHELHVGWPQATSAVQAEVIEFWLNEKAVSEPGRAKQRAAELLAVARTPDQQIAAVRTAR